MERKFPFTVKCAVLPLSVCICIYYKGVNKFSKNLVSPLEILCSKRMTFTWDTWCPGFVHTCTHM